MSLVTKAYLTLSTTLNDLVVMKQHYLPKVYLKEFENLAKKIYVLSNSSSANSPQIKERSSSQICYYPDFYRLDSLVQLWNIASKDHDIIEKKYNARMENRYGKVAKNLLSRESSFTLDSARELVTILLSFKQRNPAFRNLFEDKKLLLDMFEKRINSTFQHKATIEDILKVEGRMSFEEFVEFGQDYGVKFANSPDTPRKIHLDGIIKFHEGKETVMETIANFLIYCEWIVFETSNSSPFITSGNPGCCIDNKEQVHNLKFSEFSGFIFPLTPRYALVITSYRDLHSDKEKQVRYSKANPELVRMINRCTYFVSYKYILSNQRQALYDTWFNLSHVIPDFIKPR